MYIYICDECDTVWMADVELAEDNCQRFDVFMEANGLKPLWNELADIERNWIG
jgi:hypothetical protein